MLRDLNYQAGRSGLEKVASGDVGSVSTRSETTSDVTAATSDPDDGLGSNDADGVPTLIKRFTSPWNRKRRDKDDDEEGIRGPVGLRLLHHSPEPLIDLIFVHGLRGGSIKTWRKGNDPRCFWPQLWLPRESGFEHVNIHTFGYDSDWASLKSSILNVHDFGRGLLEDMRNAPCLRENEERPIILVGHSMGGLVIKKAFILAQDVPDFKSRIRTIFFLATPHQGTNYAAILNNILSVSGIMSSRHYISDLTAGSISIQVINDDFGRHAHGLPIYSFYETLKTSFGISSFVVVDKDCAVLGPSYRKERIQYINANHRDICKFENTNDSNYVTVKNALASAVADLLRDVSTSKREQSREQLKVLRSYLGVSDSPDEYHPKVDGSCEWIEHRDDFQDWIDCSGNLHAKDDAENEDKKSLAIFWAHANPGTGKTVLASHIISLLQELQQECAFYYFHVGDKTSRSFGPFLRSIAYQLAASNSAIRDKLFQLWQEGSTFDMDDSWTIWKKIFRKGIFQARVYTPQYLVIDAIDECNKYQEFFTMLKAEKPDFPLRIFVTSRNVHDLQRIERSLSTPAQVTCIEIPVQDSIRDIQCYIRSRIDSLPVDSTAQREELASRILSKSNACFLWVRLVLDELETVYSSESIMAILEKTPEGMIPYYKRTITAMAANTLEKHIAKAVLLWTVASVRKLTIQELSQALKLDINTLLPSAKSAVEGLCGQLVTVDKDSDVVDLVHPTAREFLLSEDAGEFAVSKPKAHERIALTCLELLSGSELRPPRNPRFLAQARPDPSPFLSYSMTQFSEHIHTASSENDKLLVAIDKFFRTNTLSWIERLALDDNLHSLIRASKNLKAYLERRAKYLSPLSNQVRNIDGWSTDLSRLVTQFGDALLRDPSSIYFLIPPLCPSESAIYRQFGKRPDGLCLVGRKNTAWDDCIARVDFEEEMAAAVSCGESMIAVGMESGRVNLYNQRSYQKEAVIHHKKPVDLVCLTDGLVASCTTRAIVLNDPSGNIVWENRLRFRCILLTSSEDRILAVSQHGHLLQWDKGTGKLLEDQEFEYRNYDFETEHNGLASRPPQLASISPDFETLSLGYRGGTVCLWDIREAEFIGWARDEDGRLASKLLFNPNPNINLLLVIYSDHDLALYDTWSGSLVHSHPTPSNAGLLSASSSPDGRTMATMDTLGNMHIWDFESLSVLYHILSPFPSFRILDFTSDGSSVVDVMDSSMRVWSPPVLVRKNTEEDASTSDDAIQLGVTEGVYESHKSVRVTAMCAHPSVPTVFAGKYNGQVVAFDAKSGTSSVLYSHSDTIIKLAASRSNVLASADVTGTVQLRQVSLKATAKSCEPPLVEIYVPGRVKQLCFSANGNYLVVATATSDTVYRVEDGFRIGSRDLGHHERKIWRWLIPSQLEEGVEQDFLLLSDGLVKRFSAESFPSPSRIDTLDIRLQYSLDEGCVEEAIDMALIIPSTQTLVLEVRHDFGCITSSTTFLFDLSSASASSESVTLNPLSTVLPKRCKHFLGFSENTKSFVFLHQNSWLSSITFPGLAEGQYTQHFFVPNEYLPNDDTAVLPVMAAEDNVVFCLHEELTSVKNGLKFRNTKVLE